MRSTPLLLLLLAGCASCVGTIGDDDVAQAANGTTDDSPPTPTLPVAALPLRPLTAYELSRTLFDLYGDEAPELAALAPTRLKARSETLVSSETIWTGTRSDLLENALYQVATRINADVPIADFLARELPRIFRRPLRPGDIDRFVALYEKLASLGKEEATARTLQAALLSPDFLYLTAIGEDGELTGLELASRLSYFIWASAPDAELLSVVDKDLRTEAGIERETRRLLLDGRASRGIARFVRSWTGTVNLTSLSHSDPAWTPALANDALTESDRYVGDWFTNKEKRPFDKLLVGDSTFVSRQLGEFYGVTSPLTDEFQKVDLPAQRVGLFTQASFLATHATQSASSPTLRGKWFMERALCHDIGTPPPDAQAKAPEFKAGMQTRDWHEELAKTKGCTGCHSLMEPPGYVYEGFDAVGRVRALDKGRPVRTNATLTTDSEMDGDYAGPRELAVAAAKSKTVRTCFSSQLLSYALGRSADEADEPLARTVSGALESDAWNAIVAITTSKSFRRTSR